MLKNHFLHYVGSAATVYRWGGQVYNFWQSSFFEILYTKYC